MFQRFLFNTSTVGKRYETLEGKQYLVVPTVMICEGVHNGSEGPLYYPPEEIANNPVVWNHKPVVIYHPMIGDKGITACDPAVIEFQKVGILFNTICGSDSRLRTECWLDVEKLKRVDNRVLEAIENNKMMEVSTGLFHTPDHKPGVWKGEAYKAIARNLQPDHLAILPDQKGSCSIADGAGLLRNAGAVCDLSHNDVKDHLHKHLNGTADEYGDSPLPYRERSRIQDVFPKHVVYEKGGKHFKHGYKVKNGKAELHGEPEEVHRQTTYVTANGEILHGKVKVQNEDLQGPLKGGLPPPTVDELSDVMRKNQFQKALEEHYSGIQQEGDWGGWVTDLWANYVVWSKDGKLFRLPYSYDDDKIRFDGEPEEVERVSPYHPKKSVPTPAGSTMGLYGGASTPSFTGSGIDGTMSPSINTQGNNMPTPTKPTQNAIHQGAHQMIHDATQHMDAHHAPGGASDSQLRTMAGGSRKEQVNHMISGGHAKEEDRKFLEDLPDDHWQRVSSYVMKGASQPIVPYSYDGIKDRSNVHMNQAQTAEQYIAAAPPEVREVLQNAMATQTAAKRQLVSLIKNNKNNRFTEQYLLTQPIPFLQGLAALAGGHAPTNNYGGQADIPMFIDNADATQTGVQNTGEDIPVLPLMALNFEKPKSQQAS